MDDARRISKELVATSSRPLVLSILAGGDRYGYEILKQLKHLSDGGLDWSGGMLYPMLHRLERDGLVEGYWEVNEEDRPRKYYRLTARGLQQMATNRESWRRVHSTLEISWGSGAAPAG